MKKTNTLVLFLMIIILPVSTLFSYRFYQSYKENQRKKFILERRKSNWISLKQRVYNEMAKFKADAGIVIKDLDMGWEISFNKDKLFPSASLAKVPIMAACFLASGQGRLNLEQKITLKSADKLNGSGVLKYMPAGSVFTVEKLISLMICDSDNTATNILTNLLGIEYLNDAFKGFGLKNTNLSRRVADYRLRRRGVENYTTAEDMAFLLEKIYTRSLVNKDVSEKCIGLLKTQRIADRIPKYMPVEIIVAHKTGLERGVCHDAGIVFTKKGDFLICVLTKHNLPNSLLAKEFIARISLLTYNYFKDSH